MAAPVMGIGVLAALLAGAALGCGQPEDRNTAAPAGATDLAGAWTVTLTLTQPPLAVDTARLRAAGRDRVRGTLTLAPNRWLRQTHVAGAGGAPLAAGVFDVDLTPFGVDVRRAESVPVAIVEALGAPDATGRRPDSVAVLLMPSGDPDAPADARVEARVRWTGDALRGTWRLGGPGRSGLSAGGTFVAARARGADR